MTVLALTTSEVVALTPHKVQDDGWLINQDSISIPLSLMESGWYSIAGDIVIEGQQRQVRVCAGHANSIHLPLTLKGRLLDLFYYDKNSGPLQLEITGKGLLVYRCEFTLAKLSRAQRIWRMARRLGLTLLRQPYQRRKAVELSWYSIFSGLQPAYRKACQLRAWHAPLSYQQWINLHEMDIKADKRRLSSLLTKAAKLSVVVYGDNADVAAWHASLASVAGAGVAINGLFVLTDQLDLAEHLPPDTLLGDASALERWLPMQGRVLMLRAGAVVSHRAMAWWTLSNAAAPFCYSDSDYLWQKRCEPQFKPDWALELERSTHYVGDVVCCQTALLRQSGWLTQDWQSPYSGQHLVLRLVEQLPETTVPEHLCAVLWHDTLSKQAANPDCVSAHLQRLNIAASATVGKHQTVRVQYQISATPLVSIIIPTRDMYSLLAACIRSVLQLTRYPAYEILIIDNQSQCHETLAFMRQQSADPRVKVLCYDQPFNYSAINNFAVAQASGELVCLLNNDTEVISADWLTEMVSLLQQPKVGAVGARLLYSDRRVQHAGDTVGPGGCADHLHSKLNEHDPGYMKRAVALQELSAVTAACLLTPKALFQRLGGLNEKDLAVAFNDVDYCLKLRAAGHRVLYTPYAELYHHESVSRGKDNTPEKAQRAIKEANYMRQRWADVMAHDPFYNPNLSYQAADFSLGRELKVKAPWQ